MKILLIDNHSKHRAEILELFGKDVTVETQEELQNTDTQKYDLIVLSGGSNIPSVLYSPLAYEKEIELIKHTDKAMLGICLGSEIITKAFEGTLQDLGSKHKGDVRVTVTDENLKKYLGKDTLEVYEAHEVCIQTMPKEFISCGYSEHGIEIIKHKTRPIIGIQFHPEVKPHKELFEWILEIVATHKKTI